MSDPVRPLLAIVMLLACSVGSAQINVEPTYEQYQPVEYSLKTNNPNSQALWQITPLDKQQRYSTRPYGDVYAFWGEPGRYQVEATVVTVDFDARNFDIKRYSQIFEIKSSQPGPNPPPGPDNPDNPDPIPPPPDPSVPTDRFNNLGQRIDAAADAANLQVDKRGRVAEIHNTIATQMFPPNQKYLRIEDVKAALTEQLGSVGLDAAWTPVTKIVSDEAAKYTGDKIMSWQDVHEFYKAVAVGYKGGAL